MSVDQKKLHKTSPSEFMRDLHPDYYSDSKDLVSYELDEPTFVTHLEYITSRNDTHDFEIFCRKLSEKTICPNLRAHTGPDGGGDSKADTETYPVSEDIAESFYIGEISSSHEKWAFAFSAKKKWSQKVNSDVESIVGTDRGYKKIICITSQYARDKDRSRIEDELTKKHGIDVVIHDRSWIVKQIIEEDRRDIAFHYLGVGKEINSTRVMGAMDYSRTKELEELEVLLSDTDAYRGVYLQQATDALLAAKLSRNLERPRIETDGRFDRAIRIANKSGTFKQKVEVHYEKIWTAFWWFDDIQFLLNSYDEFEAQVIDSQRAVELELLCNILQLLFNLVVGNQISYEESKIEKRSKKLREALESISDVPELPSNSFEARVSLLVIKLNHLILDRKLDEISDLWKEFSSILDEVDGLGEFNASRFVRFIEVAGEVVGNDQEYNNLVEEVADFVSKRKSEAEGAFVLLNRAKRLDFSDNFDMIRFLGKATVSLFKKECSLELLEALRYLTLAYRSAGMLWAARSTCLLLVASEFNQVEEDSKVTLSLVWAMKLLAWISIELNYIPDFLQSIVTINGISNSIKHNDNSEELISDALHEFDMALACWVMGVNESDLELITKLPSILDSLHLFSARSAILFRLGYEDELKKDGSIPKDQSDAEINQFYSLLASQPMCEELHTHEVIIEDSFPKVIATKIIGMRLKIEILESDMFVIAESIIASIEAFFVTAIQLKAIPYTEAVLIRLNKETDIEHPSFKFDKLKNEGTVSWASTISIENRDNHSVIHQLLMDISSQILAFCFVVEDISTFLDSVYSNEAVLQRISIAIATATSQSRLSNKGMSQMSYWDDKSLGEPYAIKVSRPEVSKVKIDFEDENDKIPPRHPNEINDHRNLKALSIIDISLWDSAGWFGTAYMIAQGIPPTMAFLFKDEESARKIFEGWLERFGNQDNNEDIYISIVRELPNSNIHHYRTFISAKFQNRDSTDSNEIIFNVTRQTTMTPDNSENIDRFLQAYKYYGAYYIAPAITNPSGGMPRFIGELQLLKQRLVVNSAKQLDPNTVEAHLLGLGKPSDKL